MDDKRFDDLTRAFASPHSRRGVLGILSGAVGAVFARSVASAAPKGDKPSKCYGEGSSCTNGKQCCSGTCANRRCTAPVPACLFATDCPGTDTECRVRTCVAGVCGFTNIPAGTPTIQQTAGDCQKNVCDGAGSITSVADDTDVPNDTNGCTTDTCSNGVPSNTPLPEGTLCGDNGGTVCNATGQCVGCLTAADCPGQDTECGSRTCIAGVCGMTFQPVGAPTTQQTAGDCQQTVCDGLGGTTSVPDGTDLPSDDGNQCTQDICVAGVPAHPPVAVGTACSQNGGTICNATGQCLQCLSAATCPGVDSTCQQRTCVNGTCGFQFAPLGTPCGPNNICNGQGVCAQLLCPTGFGNCDFNAGNGCETNLRTSASNCGACNRVCPSGTCDNGLCTCLGINPVCPPGFQCDASIFGSGHCVPIT